MCLVQQQQKSCWILQLWRRMGKWRAPVILNFYIMRRLVLKHACGLLSPRRRNSFTRWFIGWLGPSIILDDLEEIIKFASAGIRTASTDSMLIKGLGFRMPLHLHYHCLWFYCWYQKSQSCFISLGWHSLVWSEAMDNIK